jgi:hypothetical protein
MIEGVLVDRPRAKALYEARVRRGADPGLAEIKAGNIFETHVFPIFPQRGRRIRLRFAMPIPLAGLNCPLTLSSRVKVGPPPFGWRMPRARRAPRCLMAIPLVSSVRARHSSPAAAVRHSHSKASHPCPPRIAAADPRSPCQW